MAGHNATKRRPRAGSIQESLQKIETDPSHHVVGGFTPQTPIASNSPTPPNGVANGKRKRAVEGAQGDTPSSGGFLADLCSLQWVVVPESSFKMLMIPVILWANWSIMAPFVAPDLPNPFAPLLFISHYIPTSAPDDPRYQKGYNDFLFIIYYVVVWSFIRQLITLKTFRPIARYFGIRKEAKLDRFGEQGYAWLYWGFFGVWGVRIMAQQKTWWYNTQWFWLDYPQWQMKPELKCYYLVQFSYWLQQLIVLTMGLEKPRKDFKELVIHHIVTLWLIGWSYLVNHTLMGNAVFVSMDIPDTFLAFSKLLNYLGSPLKIVAFGVFTCVWTYFRHYLNLVMLWSVWYEFDLLPEHTRQWNPPEGVWMAGWLQYQIFIPILILQVLNLFWYFLILRIIYKAVLAPSQLTDDRSDDEDDGDDDDDDDDSKDE
ncbi:hypothetical protein JAAARDRAFT_166964 [Jaapia argillacea MUCL 33604]|uniref:TLC domain-containing protein n=1 Tax=Jaapia argillacea MUCL 33604 TaxID=933084 RepID=A0A067QEG3_9AGAM|nr:hypothetical protein JAAARDRAFT_166964 [Jaapia argillacea MUCL 33604]